jgi:hypothetical protein
VEHARGDVKHVLNRKLGCVTHSILTPCHVSESAVVSASLGSIAGVIITADVPVVAIFYLLVLRYVCLFLVLFVHFCCKRENETVCPTWCDARM